MGRKEPTGDSLRAPWSSRQWIDYYRDNAENLLPLPWERGAELTDGEKQAVAASIQDFQLGESSDGKILLKRAKSHAAARGDADFAEAMQLFINEEKRHAGTLARFMELAGIPLVRRSWLDSIFRWLRHRAGFEQTIVVLLTAEVIGTAYYRALRMATASPLLRRICDQLLRDEVRHTRFHAERLAILRSNRGGVRLKLTLAWHQVLFFGTSVALWTKHRRAMKAGCLNWRSYWRQSRREIRRITRLMNPASCSGQVQESSIVAEELFALGTRQ